MNNINLKSELTNDLGVIVKMIKINGCTRSKRFFVCDDFISVLRKSFFGNKAEKLPESSYYPLYVGDGLMNQMKTVDNQII